MNKAIIINPYQLTLKEINIDLNDFENILDALNDDLPDTAPRVTILTTITCDYCRAYVDDMGLLHNNPVCGKIDWLYPNYLAGNILLVKDLNDDDYGDLAVGDLPSIPQVLRIIDEPRQKLVTAVWSAFQASKHAEHAAIVTKKHFYAKIEGRSFNIDYLVGRRMKTRFEITDDGEISISPKIPKPDYNSLYRTCATAQDIVDKVNRQVKFTFKKD